MEHLKAGEALLLLSQGLIGMPKFIGQHTAQESDDQEREAIHLKGLQRFRSFELAGRQPRGSIQKPEVLHRRDGTEQERAPCARDNADTSMRNQAGHRHGDDIEHGKRALDSAGPRNQDGLEDHIDPDLHPDERGMSRGGREPSQHHRIDNRNGVGEDD